MQKEQKSAYRITFKKIIPYDMYYLSYVFNYTVIANTQTIFLIMQKKKQQRLRINNDRTDSNNKF